MRNLGLVVAFCLATILPGSSLALGLGEIEVKSFLNQPLEAEIEVISARPGEIDDLLVSLASREAFSRAGLARPRHLSDLRFSVRKSESGEEAVIVVTTKAGVKEPFLNFLIEADWSKGRVLREFTILLDPPFYADQPPPVEPVAEAQPAPLPEEEASVSEIAEQAGVTSTVAQESGQDEGGQAEAQDEGGSAGTPEPIALAGESASAQASEPEPLPLPEPQPVSEPYAASSSQGIAAGDVSVVKGDTLWSIARRYKDDAHSMSQVMLAFQRANPDAFRNGNINDMKAGSILRVPSAEEMDALSQQDAYAEVLVQHGLWDEYVARVTGVSPATAVEAAGQGEGVAGDAGAGQQGETELSLLMPEEGSGDTAGTGDTGELEDLRTKLAMAEEELEASRVENRELESRIAELQARLSKIEELQSMMQIEDDSLATLQNQQAESEAASAADSATQVEDTLAAGQISEATEANEEALLQELLAEEAAAQAEEQAALQGGSEDGMVSDEAPADGTQMVETTLAAAEDTLVEEPANEGAEAGQATPPPAPVIITEQAEEPSIFDGILPRSVIDMIPSMPSLGGLFSDPITLGALGGIVVLLLVLLLVRRKKKTTDDQSGIKAGSGEDLFADDEEEELTPIHLAESETPDDTDIKFPTDEDLSEPPPRDQQTLTATSEIEAAEPADDLAATAIISAVDMPEPEAPAAAAARVPEEQDDVLNEVDVYLAYGLYDNAEELLSSSLTENPERADYRAKLLDTYFATKNGTAFIKEAEKLKSMGDVASRYWDRVQVMGYELAPDNALFSDAKDSDLSAADLEITKPQEADFDLGASEDDDTNFSTTDFNLGEEDTGGDFSETSSFGDADEVPPTEVISPVGGEADTAPTQVISRVDELPELADEDETNLNQLLAAGDGDDDLPEDIGELDFSIDDDEGSTIQPATEEADDMGMDFDLDDVDLDDEDSSDFDLGDDLDAALGDDDASQEDAVELDLSDYDEEFIAKTEVISPDFDEVTNLLDDDEEPADGEGIDLGMDDTGIMNVADVALETGELQIAAEAPEPEVDEDISVLDFGAEDFDEPSMLGESADLDDSLLMDVDLDDEEEAKTGTFAPGDFDEPTAAADSLGDLDDLDDLMLPDDVDEVSTKLDLARAFIDMGDTEGARGSLEEVLSEGNEAQKEEAQQLLNQI